MSTLKDVATRAGVSPSLVSYVLNGKKQVKAETYQRIRTAIQELDYRPNLLARSLKTKESLTIGILVPDLKNIFFIEIIKGIEDAVNAAGYSTILCNSDNNPEREKRYMHILLSKNIDGLVYIGTGNMKPELEQNDLPVVVIDRDAGDDHPSVTVDNMRGGYLATEYLIRSGRKRIAFIGLNEKVNTFYDRYRGYLKAFGEYGIEPDARLHDSTMQSYEGGYIAMCKLLETAPFIDAVFASSDFLAFGAVRAVVDSGLSVPADVAIVGYDDVSMSKYLIPSLTTIRQPTLEMGERAAEMLVRLMKGQAAEEKKIVLQPQLIIRETA